MPTPGERIVQKGSAPRDNAVRAWLGVLAWGHWRALVAAINSTYPGVFRPEWIYGGEKHGWTLRFRRVRPFCTLVPEHRRLLVTIVLSASEQLRADAVTSGLGRATRSIYAAAPTYQDDKWLTIPVRTRADVADILKLLAVKRRPERTTE